MAIIGFGPAAVNAAISLRNSGYEGGIDVFTDTDILPYSPILTSYYVAGEKEFEECFPWKGDEIESLALNIHYNSPVRHLDPKERRIETDSGEFFYSKCVIATGSRPLSNGFPKECGYDPMMLRTMKDAEAMKASFQDEACKKVLISGASMVALKILEAAIANGKEATLVGMNDHILDFNALPEVAKRFEVGLKERGVELKLGRTISSVEVVEDIDAYKGRLLHVGFTSGESGIFDEICVAHGMACNLDFLDEGALEIGAAILVDDHMRSSDPDIYAAGDVAQALELVSNDKKIVGIWKNAVNQGRIAGNAIARELMGDDAGDSDFYAGSISSNTIAVDGILFISGGTIDLDGGKDIELYDDGEMTLACIYDPKRLNMEGEASLVGFNLSCDHDDAGSKAYDIGAMLAMHIVEDCSGCKA